MHKYSHSRNTRGSSRLCWCVKSSLSSWRHVSHVAALATEHLYTISLTYITCLPTILLSPTCPVSAHSGLECETLRDPRRSGGYTKSASPTCEPKFDTIWRFRALSNLKLDRNPGRRFTASKNLTGILGQIRIKNQKEYLGMTIEIPSQKIRRKTGNFLMSQRTLLPIKEYTQTTIQLKALQTRILKMENYEKFWSHHCVFIWARRELWFFSKTHSFRETRSKNNTEEMGKCKSYSS